MMLRIRTGQPANGTNKLPHSCKCGIQNLPGTHANIHHILSCNSFSYIHHQAHIPNVNVFYLIG